MYLFIMGLLNNKEDTMETQNAGIDYGMGLSNIDNDTGIRYGVISMHEVSDAWCEESEEGMVYACPYCGEEIEDIDTDLDEQTCSHCGKSDSTENWYADSGSFTFEDGNYIAKQFADDTDIFITKSPYYTLCNFCSPCAPGAGYIMEQNKNGVKAYCFGHDWFDDGKAPYKVFDVKTDKEALCK